jgi:hypothetical protein
MADQNRNQKQNRDNQQSSQPSGSQQQTGSPRRESQNEVQQTQGNRSSRDESLIDDDMTGSRSSSDRGRSGRESQSIANDRPESDRSRRDFSSDREADELGSETSEMSDETLEDDDDLGGSGGRSNR